ncbi:MAG: penicillin acylase family protein, partial [Bacteroidota bacterium]
YLGWAHTVNHPDLTDIYKLEMNPDNPKQYKFDGQWETLAERKVKIKVKVGPLKFGKKFKFYWSKYGATMEKDGSYYSLRFAANMRIKAPEQHYWMNKARNLSEFKKALNLQYLPSFNIVYADREGNILYLNNGLIPYRQAGFDWTQVLPGNTSKTLWGNRFHPLQDLPQILNPPSGYVFNTNNTPFNATAPTDNLDAEKYDIRMGHIRYENNRSTRMQALISQYDKLSYEDFKTVKYDWQYPKPLKFSIITNLESLFSMDVGSDQSLAPLLKQIQFWDRKNQPSSKGAGAFCIFLHKLGDMLQAQGRLKPGNQVTPEEMKTALRQAQSHLQEFFGRTEVSLGDLQRHQRGEVDLPIGGAFDVLAAMYAEPVKKKGYFRASQGESYILLARFDENGPILESVNAYGSSNREDDPHYTDQMNMFVQRNLKKMS